MNKQYLLTWSFWIGLVSGIYCLVYASTTIIDKNIIWMAFVALPIYFGSGAKIEEFPHFFSSILSGVVWGLIMLNFIGFLTGNGLSGPVSMFFVVTICTFICVFLHMVILAKTWLNQVPMIFGGLAMTFATGGTNLIYVIITMTSGLLMGVAISEGGKIIDKMLSAKNIEKSLGVEE